MRLATLRVEAYGCLVDATLAPTLEGRLTIVLGPNEAGKSTAFHAVESLLYGFVPASIERFPYRSWEVALYPAIEADLLLDDGRRAQVRRRLGQRPQGTLEIGDARISLGNRPLPMLKHVPRSLFAALYALRLESLRPLTEATAAELQDRLLGEVAWGALRSPREVAAELEEEAARLWRSDRRGKPLSRRLRERIAELKEARRAAEEREAALRAAARRSRALREELAHVETALAAAREELRRVEEMVPLRNKVEAYAAGLVDSVWDERAARRLVDIDPALLRRRIEAVASARAEWEERQARRRAAEEGLPEPREEADLRLWIAGAAFGGILVALGIRQEWTWLAGAGGALAAGALLAALVRRSEARRRRAEAARRREAVERLAEEEAQAAHRWTQERQALERLLAGVPVARALLDRASPELFHRLNDLRAQQMELFALQEALGEATPEEPARERGERNDVARLRERVAAYEQRRAELLREAGRLEAQLQAGRRGPTLGELDGEIAALQEELRRCEKSRDRLVLQANLLRFAEARYRREHQPDVLRRASEYLRAITGGRYTLLSTEAPAAEIDEGREGDTLEDREALGGAERSSHGERRGGLGEWAFDRLTVVRRDAPAPLLLSQPLSRGTLDQVFLAFRLAALDHLDEGEERLPVLLDEALVHWDPSRLDRGLQVLGDVASRRQVILFTCHPWLADRARHMAGAEVIEWTGAVAEGGRVRDPVVR